MSALPVVIVGGSGRNGAVADGMRTTPGRPARDFADDARATAATGGWRAWR